MEYAFYALVIALTSLITALAIGLMRRFGYFGGYQPKTLMDPRQRRVSKDRDTSRTVETFVLHRARQRAMEERLRNVPTPWGWPQSHKNDQYRLSKSLHDFADKLVHRKTVIDNDDYLRRRDVCIKALLEDRYGRVFDQPGMREGGHQPAKLSSRQMSLRAYRSRNREAGHVSDASQDSRQQ
jgi:hypothetical protein